MPKSIRNYLSLVKFSHTVFALPFAAIGYILAINDLGSGFDLRLFIHVLLCMLFARSAAMGFNRYADRKIDQKNPRTQKREIPAGIISPKAALIFVIISSLLFILTTWFINMICFILSPVALMIILGYSFTKRFTSLSHFVLGLGLSLSPIGAYLAVTGKFAIVPLMYSGLVFFWVAGFDIIYALQDESFDRNEKLKSIPSRLGVKKALVVSIVSHIICLGFLISSGIIGRGNLFFWVGTIIFTVLLIYQHYIVKPKDLHRVNQAFAVTNGFAGVLFAICFILDVYFRVRTF
jgi:4-hydroxybenzoate polyprenyltransferase